MRFLAERDRRRPAGVHQQRGHAGIDALIAGMRRVQHRRAARVVIGKCCRKQVDRRWAHAVELGEIAIGMPEEPQHRHHAIDGIVDRLRRLQVARREQLPQRQQIDQEFDQRAGIAADMAAVGQHLRAQLVEQPPRHRPQLAGHVLQAQGCECERDQRLQARHALAAFIEVASQIAHLPRQAADEAAIKASVGVLQHERRLVEPADDAARQNFRLPADRVPAALLVNPVVDQCACVGAGDRRIGGAQMAQPREAQQNGRPLVGRRRHLEGRAAVANHHLAGEGKTAGIDFGGARGVGGSQILRRDHQPVGLGRTESPAQQWMRAESADQAAQGPAADQRRQPGSFADRHPRH